MDIQFLVSNKGSLAKPQKIIVGARIVYQTGGFEYLCSSTICRTVAGSLVSEKAPFEIRSSVTFVSAVTGNTLSSYVPDPPTIIASLPNDIFYPFVINEATVNSP